MHGMLTAGSVYTVWPTSAHRTRPLNTSNPWLHELDVSRFPLKAVVSCVTYGGCCWTDSLCMTSG